MQDRNSVYCVRICGHGHDRLATYLRHDIYHKGAFSACNRFEISLLSMRHGSRGARHDMSLGMTSVIFFVQEFRGDSCGTPFSTRVDIFAALQFFS